MSRTVEVTQGDIDNGRRTDAESCPLALAVCRALNVPWASVADYIITEAKSFECPPDARRFWRDFDKGRPVAPFSFALEPAGEGMDP